MAKTKIEIEKLIRLSLLLDPARKKTLIKAVSRALSGEQKTLLKILQSESISYRSLIKKILIKKGGEGMIELDQIFHTISRKIRGAKEVKSRSTEEIEAEKLLSEI